MEVFFFIKSVYVSTKTPPILNWTKKSLCCLQDFFLIKYVEKNSFIAKEDKGWDDKIAAYALMFSPDLEWPRNMFLS